MKPAYCALLISLLLVLLVGTQGIRLEQGLKSSLHQKSEEKENSMIEANAGVLGEVVPCRDGHCSSGRSRNLMTNTISTSTTTTTSKSVKKNGGKPTSKRQKGDQGFGGNEENFSVESSPPVSERREASPKHYPDIIDIAGMDYSPIRRKPPIHN
ncbi:PREDICTED: uncharacterized protein LOC104588495 [Nelumbo nucifera]|uniref:Uncharacterized protein LOC104588495 n=2 Tax=Nelumbo nucifera TaxID=4432 RepID=A0A1U7YW88_NELNU|nr:PREDICTED: uncharacterized protein LOC104588495 [Nelumbo nucifera]DAD45099.1 TPA_asm: hypothetical protein HUJ06_003329 [Nelumbo nucifera]